MPSQRKTLLSGHTVEPMEGKEWEEYQAMWGAYTKGISRYQPGGLLMPTPFEWFHDRIYNFKFSDTDVVVMTWPKCGTTWMQEIVWTLRNNPNLDHPMAGVPVNARVPFIELDSLLQFEDQGKPEDNPLITGFLKRHPNLDPKEGIFIHASEQCPKPRTIKTHLPFSFMPKDMLDKAKVIYVLRNPKDVVVSYLHHCRLMRAHDYVGDLDQFVQQFVDGDLIYGHYDLHLKEAFERKAHPNLHIVNFEDIKADPVAELTKIDRFLKIGNTEDQIKKICHYISFDEMKKRDSSHSVPKEGQVSSHYNMDVFKEDGGFFRKGEAGSWKEKLTPELSGKVDAWVAEKLKDLRKELKYL